MKTSLICLTSAVVLMGTGAEAAQKIPLSAALAQCKMHVNLDQGAVMDGGDSLSAPRGEQLYRACVFAKSGKYPPKSKSTSGLAISGSARFGIVYQE